VRANEGAVSLSALIPTENRTFLGSDPDVGAADIVRPLKEVATVETSAISAMDVGVASSRASCRDRMS
jgi:hypothetical protein